MEKCLRMSDLLIFNTIPSFTIATNTFVNCPIILQYDETPLIQLVREVDASFTTEIDIYHNDGTFLAKAKGTQLYATEDGKKAGVTLRHPDRLTVCEMAGKTLFELERQQAAALKGSAELYTPDGFFIRAVDSGIGRELMERRDGAHMQIGGMHVQNCSFKCRVGIHIKSDGSIGVAVA